MATLETWCLENPEHEYVKVITGQAGQGKTRLALELCRRMEAHGWHAGLVASSRTLPELDGLTLGRAPRLLVFDYAESHLATLPEFLRRLKARKSRLPKVRVLLLSRQLGDWFRLISAQTGVEDLFDQRSQVGLDPLIVEEAGRHGELRRALGAFQGKLEDPATPSIDLDSLDLSHERYESVLQIHMAACSLLHEASASEDELPVERVFRHEKSYWRRLAESQTHDADELEELILAYQRLMATATLCEGLHWKVREALIHKVLEPFELSQARRKGLIRRLDDLYGQEVSKDSEDQRMLGALTPDLLGEHLLAKELKRSPELIDAALDLGGLDLAPRVLRQLGRLCEKDLRAARPWFRQALQGRISDLGAAAIETLVEATTKVYPDVIEAFQRAELAPATLASLTALCDRVSSNPTLVSLREIACELTTRTVDVHQELWSSPEPSQLETLAKWLSNLGVRLSDLGRREQALDATQEAVQILRRLAKDRPDAFLPTLATSLNNLGNRLSELGREAEALEASREATAVLKPFYLRIPDAFSGWMRILVGNYLRCCVDSSIPPDPELIAGLEELFPDQQES